MAPYGRGDMSGLLIGSYSALINANSSDLDILAATPGWQSLKGGRSSSLREQLGKVTFSDFDLWLRSLVSPMLLGACDHSCGVDVYSEMVARKVDGSTVRGKLVASVLDANILGQEIPLVVVSLQGAREGGWPSRFSSSGRCCLLLDKSEDSRTTMSDEEEDDDLCMTKSSFVHRNCSDAIASDEHMKFVCSI